MEIIQTPARFPPYTGGVEQYTHILSKKLVKRGHDVTVICANEPEQDEVRTTYDGIKVIRLNDVGKIAQTNITPALPIELARQVWSADVVHTHLPTPWTADVSALIASASNTPSIVTYHNDIRGDGLASYVARLYNATAMQVTLTLSNHIITTQESYFEDSNIPQQFEDKVTTIRNGVDVNRFRPLDVEEEMVRKLGFDPDATNLFFLSVLDEYHDYKGLEILLGAMRELSEQYHLVVGGDGSKRAHYEQRCRELGVEEQVTFVGYVPDDDLPVCYNAADVFVLPSTSSEQEGFGLVLLEALACSTPVVTTDVVGVAEEVKREELGVVISESEAERIARSVLDITSSAVQVHPERAREICVEQYSWDEISAELEALYESFT